MARVYGIKKGLKQGDMSAECVKQIIGSGNLIEITERMETMVDFDTMSQIYDSCACLGGKAYLKICEKIGKQLAGLSLREKIDYLNGQSNGTETIVINDDGTLTVTLAFRNGEQFSCVCSAAVSKGVKVSDIATQTDSDAARMPLSYCLCCAGSFRQHLQLKLNAAVNTKSIISSPINSGGREPCSFILEIV